MNTEQSQETGLQRQVSAQIMKNQSLDHIFTLMRERQVASDPDSVAPAEIVLQLMSRWFQECRRLLLTEVTVVEGESQYAEAVDYMDMHMLEQLHASRVAYEHLFPTLNNDCHSFLSSACIGMSYERTHRFIVEATCRLMNGDDFLFYVGCQKESLDVLLMALSVEQKSQTHKLIFNHLKLLIDQHNGRPEILKILTEFLTTKEILKIYYQNFYKPGKQLLPLLNLLNSLQRHLDCLECFPDHFLAAMLEALLDPHCPELAATLYINMMQTKGVSNNFLVHQIMEHYLNREPTMTKHPGYIHKISRNFPYLRHNLAKYFMFITANNTDSPGSVLAAKFVLAVYKDMLPTMNDNVYGIMKLLYSLPGLLVEFHCKPAMGVLLEVLEVTDFTALKESCALFGDIIEDLEIYALKTFYGANDMEYPLLKNLYTQLVKLVEHTGNKGAMDTASEQIISDCLGLDRVLKVYDAAGEFQSVGTEVLHEYCTDLKKLSLIFTHDVDSKHQMVNVLEALRVRFFDRPQTLSLAQRNHTFIDLYCVEVLTKCSICISRKPSMTQVQRSVVKQAVVLLQHHLSQQLENRVQLLMKPVVVLKTVYNSLVNLLIAFPFRSPLCPLPLDSATYEALNIVLAFSVKTCHVQFPPSSDEASQVTSQISLEHRRQMCAEYIQLHKTEAIWLPTNDAWIVVAQYSLPLQAFDAELEELITALAINHLETYERCMGMVIYALYKALPKSSFTPILKAHKILLEKILPHRVASHSKLNILLIVLHMTQKLLEVTSPGTNRIQILKHLPVLINTWEWNKEEHQRVLISAAPLWNPQLSSEEERILRNFMEPIRKQKSMAVAVIPGKEATHA